MRAWPKSGISPNRLRGKLLNHNITLDIRLGFPSKGGGQSCFRDCVSIAYPAVPRRSGFQVHDTLYEFHNAVYWNLHVELPLHQPTSFGEHLQQQLDGYENVGQHSPRQVPIFVRTRSSHLQINKVPHTRLHKVGDEVGPKLEMQNDCTFNLPERYDVTEYLMKCPLETF